jgi:hypothetical protein
LRGGTLPSAARAGEILSLLYWRSELTHPDLHARIDAVLHENEYRMDFLREAVERELKRRRAAPAKSLKPSYVR